MTGFQGPPKGLGNFRDFKCSDIFPQILDSFPLISDIWFGIRQLAILHFFNLLENSYAFYCATEVGMLNEAKASRLQMLRIHLYVAF